MLPQSWTHQRDYEAQGQVQPATPEAPVPFWDSVARATKTSAEDQWRTRTAGRREQAWIGSLIDRHKEIERITGRRFAPSAEIMRTEIGEVERRPGQAPRRARTALPHLTSEAYEREIDALRAQYPELASLPTRDSLWARHEASLRDVRKEAQEAGSKGAGGAIGSFLGGSAAAMADPVNLGATLVTGGLGAGRPLLGRMLMQGGVNVGIEGAQMPGRAADAANYGGPDYTPGEMAQDVAFAGAGAAGFEALAAGGRVLWRQAARGLSTSEDAGERGIASAIDRLMDDEAMVEGAADPDAARAALNRGDPRPEVQAEHELDDLFANQRQSPPQQGSSGGVVTSGDHPQGGLQSAEYMGRTIWSGRFDPLQVEADPARFQYKADGDIDGVTARLKGIERWDATASGKAILFEDVDGRVVVADGHQRRGLARRLAEQGWEDAQLDGYLFKSSDGWTARDVRVVAALKNIREGSGSIMDAAKLFREAPAAVKDKSLPVTGDFIHQARQLASLSDEAFGAVVNGVIPERYGAVLGEVVGDRPELQGDLVDLLRRGEPGSIDGARALIHEALLDDFISREGVQGDLFGGLPRESTVIARGKIREAVMRALRKDERTFAALVKNADAVEAGGNILARNENEARLAIDRASQEVVSRLALRAGEIGEAFSDMAKAVTQGEMTPANAAKGLVQRIRNGVKTGELLELERKDMFDPDPPSEVGLRAANDFSEPAGLGQKAQLEPKPEDAELEMGEAAPGLFDDLELDVPEERALSVLRACAPGGV